MPPKTGTKQKKAGAKDAKLKKKVQEKRSGKTKAFPAQTISELNAVRGRLIATQLGIKNSSKFSFPSELVPLIKDKMALISDCPECGGACQPDTHTFPEVKPREEDDEEVVEDEEEDDESDSGSSVTSEAAVVVDTVVGDESPDRSIFSQLNDLHSPHDLPVGGAIPPVPFITHVTDQIATEHGLPDGVQPSVDQVPPRQSTSRASPRQSTSRTDEESVASSSDDEDLGEALKKKIAAAQAQQEKELAEAARIAKEKRQKKSSAAQEKAERKKRKEERAKKRADAEKRILAEMDKKHKAALASISAAADEDDDVFSTPSAPRVTLGVEAPSQKSSHKSKSSKNSSNGSSRSRTKSRVSFDASTRSPESPRSPRSSSTRSSRDFHPEYSGGSRSHSVSGTSVEMNVLMQLMDRQQKSTEAMVAAMGKMAEATNRRVPLTDLGGFEDAGGSAAAAPKNSSGTLKMVSSGKSEMARALGVNPGVKLAFTGDTDNIDVSKLKKNLQSGKYRKQGGIVVRQHVWPHDVVSRASSHLWPKPKPGQTFEFGHWDQTFAMFQEGFCQKILVDHGVSMDPIIKNKLRMQAYLIRQSYILSWEDILSVVEQFFEAYEHDVVDWDDWADIEVFLRSACEQARLSAFARSNPLPAAVANPSSAAIKPAQKYEGHIKGVPWKFMKSKNICCGFNTGSCKQQCGHKIGESKVFHWCGGCFGASKGSTKEAHPCKTCEKGPWDKSLFQ